MITGSNVIITEIRRDEKTNTFMWACRPYLKGMA